MTREGILKMEAGRELDVLVFRQVFNRRCERVYPTEGEYGCELDDWYECPQRTVLPELVPHFSKHMESAWLVVEKMNESGCHATLNVSGSRCSCGFWGERFASVGAETMPLAICRASLLVVEEQLPKHSE